MEPIKVADTATHLSFARLGIWLARCEMAMSGAPADALKEIDDDFMQVGRWWLQTQSTIDDTMIRRTAMCWLKIYEYDPKRCDRKTRKRASTG